MKTYRNMQFKIPADLIKEEDITAFELEAGLIFPSDYRQFLLTVNGGEQPMPETFKIENGNASFLSQLFSLKKGDSMALEDQFVQMKLLLSDNIIPIGLDMLGNKICLAVSDHERGVWFWDHESSATDENSLLFIDSCFEAFIDHLYPNPYRTEIDEIEWLGKFGKLADLLKFLSKNNDLESKNSLGRNIVQEAARYGNVRMIEAAINQGFSPIGALHFAAMNSRIEAIECLLKFGVDINEKDSQGRTPLSRTWDTDISRLLIERGAKK